MSDSEGKSEPYLPKLHSPMRERQVALSRFISNLTNSTYRGAFKREISRFLDRNRTFTRPQIRLRRGHEELHGLRIAFVSDVHAGSFMDEQDLTRVFAKVAEQEPDLVCLGGDLVDHYDHQALMLRKAVSLLSPPLGVFAVPGNHEYHAESSLLVWRSVLQDMGVNILINRGERVQRGAATLWIAGVDDYTEGHPDLEQAVEGRKGDEPILLLSHHPDFFREACLADVDLMLSGHTHGGQILPFGRALTGHTKLGYWSGRFEAPGGSQLYVGRGAGVGFLPVRLGAPGEIAVVELQRN
ncbi:MAG: metallophosphoesterase [bacterium]|nr:metallophosphoesterase [bacterium]